MILSPSANEIEVAIADTSNQKKIVLHFSASWCSECHKIESELIKLFDRFNSELIIYHIDTDELSELTDKMQISKLPSFLFYCNGFQVDRYFGSDMNDITAKVLNLINLTSIPSGHAQSTYMSEEVTSTNDLLKDNTTIVWPSIQIGVERFAYDFLPVKNISLDAYIPHQSLIDKMEFLSAVGLGNLPITANMMRSLRAKKSVVNECFDSIIIEPPTTEEEIFKLFEYRVPMISEDGSCSIADTLSKTPFNLAIDAYKLAPFDLSYLQGHFMTSRLQMLNALVLRIYELTNGADWIGIYKIVDVEGTPTLLKESYRGEPSRPLFPVTATFAQKSTNSWVALTGNVRSIPNTRAREEGVSYYECSGKVRSELCLPILRPKPSSSIDGSSANNLNSLSDIAFETVGIIDIESWNENHFSPSMIIELMQICLDLGINSIYYNFSK
jgi:putative methionine-R-sulfoxide reductase with GAF domain/thiol-disulfide isomerase/thioredoxin